MRRLYVLLFCLSACTSGGGQVPDAGSAVDGGIGQDAQAGSDAGLLEDSGQGDSGVGPPDSGAETPDAGADSGVGPADTGLTPTDSGAAMPDSGAALPDAGAGQTPVVVAVGYGNRRTSTFDGMSWGNDEVVDPNGGDDNNLLRGVGYAGGRFVAVGGGGQGQSWVSDDGRTWTHHVTTLRAFVSDAVFGNGVWVAAGGNGLRLVSTDRGESWHGDPGYYAGHYRGIAFGNGRFVAAGHRYGASSDGLTAVSTDGLSWQVLEHNGLGGFSAITFGQGLFIATGSGRLAVSTDGAQWDEIALGSMSLSGPSVANGEVLIPANDGLWRSTDGRHYNFVRGFVPGSIIYAFGRYFGVTWQSQRWTTTDLAMPWTRAQGNDGPAFTEILEGLVP